MTKTSFVAEVIFKLRKIHRETMSQSLFFNKVTCPRLASLLK